MSDVNDKRPMSEEEAKILSYVLTVVSTNVRGMMAGNPRIKPELFLMVSAAALGQLVGEMYTAHDELQVHRFRKLCRDAFNDYMKAVPIHIAKLDGQADTAVPAGAS